MNNLQSHRSFSKNEAALVGMPTKHWYVISTKPHQEASAEANIRRLGVETFCPRLMQRRVIRHGIQACVNPLFPGYMFARFEMEHHYRFILYTRGIKKIVSFGEEPAIVEDRLIEEIRRRLQDGCGLDPGAEFRHGQVVRIKHGPLHGLEAIFENEMTGAQRAMLLLKTLSYQARVVVDLKDIVNS